MGLAPAPREGWAYRGGAIPTIGYRLSGATFAISSLRQVAARRQRPHAGAQLVAERYAVGDLHGGDFLVADSVQVLDQRPERVAKRDDQHGDAGAQARDD